MKFPLAILIGLALVSTPLLGQTPTRIIADEDLGSGTYVWSADTIYLLDGLVFLEANGILNIEAGAVVKAQSAPTTSDSTSALIITSGASIHAKGEYLNPIIFTSDQDDLTDPGDLGISDAGLWGGIIILGSAPVLSADSSFVLEAHPYLPSADPRSDFGGNTPDDNSGTLNYVSIRFAGSQIGDQSSAGLSLAGVGDQTIVKDVDVFASGGDGFSFLGGLVDTRELAASFCSDDAFDWDLGYRGRNQYWFGLMGPNIADCGLEGRGMHSQPIIYNFTLIGSGQGATAKNPVAVRLTDGSGGHFGMGILADFPHQGVEVEDLIGEADSYTKLTSGSLRFISNIWSDFGAGNSFSANVLIQVANDAEDPTAALLATNLADSNYIEPNYIPHISRTAERKLNPDYFTDVSTEFKSSYPDDDFFVRSVDLCSGWGAFITEGAWWLKYWTGLDNGQYLMHPCFLNFFKMKDFTSELRGGDTINIFCEELEDLPNVDPECFNSFCQFPNQVLGLAMRRNGKKRRLEFPNLPYCYMQEIEYEGYENILDSETGIFTRLDTFYVNLTLLVSDSTTPEMLIKPCDTCIIGLTASPLDCDTAWITRSDSIIVNDSIIEYFWEAEDRCMNFNRLAIFKNLLAADQIWYEDLDADGFGNENNSVIWAGQIPGYSLIGGDCDDLNAQRHPGIMEDSMDNFDNDCDGHGNFEECLNSDFLAYASECLPQVYHWNPAQLEFNSNDATCFLLDSRFDGDIWFQTSAPESGSLNIAFVADFEPFKMYLSRGNCNQLEVIDCPDSSVIDVDNLVPSEPLFIQLVNDRGTSTPFSICLTSSENTTSLPEINPNEYFRTYPNPVQNFQNMEWKIEKPTTASLNIYSIFGQRVATIFENEYLSQTVGHTTFNTGRLVGGYYVVMLKTSEKTFIHKILKH